MKYKTEAKEACFEKAMCTVRELLPEKMSGRLLDIGCYKGYLKDSLPSSIDYVGIDVDSRFPECIECDLNNKKLPFKDAEFDWIVATNVLEHIFYPAEICEEIQRILKPGGTAIISLPNDHGICSRIASNRIGLFRKHVSFEDQIYLHHWVFSLKTARQFISKYFDIVEEYYHNGHILSRFDFILKYFPGTCSDFYMKVRKKA